MSSDTPRSDAEHWCPDESIELYVPKWLSQELERELTAALEAKRRAEQRCAELEGVLRKMADDIADNAYTLAARKALKETTRSAS